MELRPEQPEQNWDRQKEQVERELFGAPDETEDRIQESIEHGQRVPRPGFASEQADESRRASPSRGDLSLRSAEEVLIGHRELGGAEVVDVQIWLGALHPGLLRVDHL